MTEEEAEIATQTLEQADITISPTRGRLAVATTIAVELDHPAYDAVYLAVAEASDLRFVTADNRLTRKIRERQNRFRQRLIALSEIE